MLDGKQQLDKLIMGNERYATGTLMHPNSSFMRRRDTARNGQYPIAATLSCADSRVPIEMVFDQGIGDIFSVRTAGNLIDELVLGSLELGISQFDIPLLCVLGHTNCGAIKFAVEVDRLSGNMSRIIHGILPVLERVTRKHPQLSKEELLAKVTEENVRSVIREIRENSELINERVMLGVLLIKGGIIDIESGEVGWLD